MTTTTRNLATTSDEWPITVQPDAAGEVTDDDIRELSAEAGRAGDLEMVAICRWALDGDECARDRCVEVILDARGQS